MFEMQPVYLDLAVGALIWINASFADGFLFVSVAIVPDDQKTALSHRGEFNFRIFVLT